MTEDPRKEELLSDLAEARKLGFCANPYHARMPFHAVGTLIGCANHEVDEAAKHVRDLTEALIQADKDRIPGGGRVAKALDEIKEGYETRLKNQAASIENLQLIRRELLALAEELFDGLNGPMIIMPEHMSRLAARLKNHQEGG